MKNSTTERLNRDKDRPEMRSFTPKAASPCLQQARRESQFGATTSWRGNCGCTCLCPNPPSK